MRELDDINEAISDAAIQIHRIVSDLPRVAAPPREPIGAESGPASAGLSAV
jgi:hypothetical protein